MELKKDFKGSKFHNRQGEQDFYQAIFAFDFYSELNPFDNAFTSVVYSCNV